MNKSNNTASIDGCFVDESTNIDYKNTDVLKKFLSPEGKILPSRRTGLSSKNHRKLARAIKRARFICLLPYISYSS